jgi:hypothetical protein
MCEGYTRKYSWIRAKFPEWSSLLSDPDAVESVDSADGGDAQSSRRLLFSGNNYQRHTLAKDANY